VQHTYPSLQRTVTEYLVLDFSPEGRLTDFNLSITSELYQKFVREGKAAGDWQERQTIIKFLERYRTAFQVRDVETMERMFADNAIIIVGRRIRDRKLDPDVVHYERFADQPEFAKIRLSKARYLKNLSAIFRAQEDVLLDFSSFRIVRKGNAPKVYGVEMRQGYHVTTYADEGYLFLLVDFAPEEPLIYVRAWQPHAWRDEELINTSNFRVYK